MVGLNDDANLRNLRIWIRGLGEAAWGGASYDGIMCGVRLVDRVLSTDVLLDRLGVVVKIEDMIIQSRLRGYGHVMHGDINSQIREVTEIEVIGKRKKGRPRKERIRSKIANPDKAGIMPLKRTLFCWTLKSHHHERFYPGGKAQRTHRSWIVKLEMIHLFLFVKSSEY